MADIVYVVVEHDGGWAYKVGDVFSERFDTHEAARAAAASAAKRQQLDGEPEVIEYQDAAGRVHVELDDGSEHPSTDVVDKAEKRAG
jgi:hypothetical protein